MEEIWKDIKGYEGYYQVSNLGRVKSLERTVNNGKKNYIRPETILKPSKNKGYSFVILTTYSKGKTFLIHRLVANAFIANPENKPQVNHINSIRDDNRIENLEWVTNIENQRHSWKFNNRKKSPLAGPKLKPVICYNYITNEFIGEYKSLKEAASILNIGKTGISAVLRKVQHNTNGYIFKYKIN